jgi:hypothetical protein
VNEVSCGHPQGAAAGLRDDPEFLVKRARRRGGSGERRRQRWLISLHHAVFEKAEPNVVAYLVAMCPE